MSRNKNKSKLTVAAGRLVKQDRRETRTDWLVRPLTLFFSFSEWQVLRNYKTRGSRIGAAQKGRRHRKSIYIVWNRGASTMPGLGVLHGSVSPSFRSHGSALSWSFSETISTGKGESAVDRVSKLQTRQLELIYFEAELERPGQFVSFSFSVDHIEYRFFFGLSFGFSTFRIQAERLQLSIRTAWGVNLISTAEKADQIRWNGSLSWKSRATESFVLRPREQVETARNGSDVAKNSPPQR